ncbi:MAG: hypothetical protein ING77_12875, partial [Rhodocyclaceae bacterium]|nr:hypothetical protein [Rhodocyclaceae bacterium]
MRTNAGKRDTPAAATGFWLLAGACIALALATRHSDIARLLAHWLLHPFRSGIQGDTLLLVPGAAAALLAVLALSRHSTAAWWDRADAGQLLLTPVVFAHAVALFALLGVQERLDLPWQLEGRHWSGNAFSTVSLLHSDLGSSALATLPTLVPAMERWAVGLPLMGAFATALAAAPGIARRHDWHPVAVALFMAATLHCLWAVLDGGVLAPGVSGSLLMLALLVCARDTAHLRALVRRHGLSAFAALVAVACGRAAIAREGWGSMASDLAVPALLYGMALVCWAFRAAAGGLASMAALVATLCFLGISYLDDALSGTGLLLRPLPAQARIVVLDAAGNEARDASTALRGATPLAVYRRFGDDPLAPRRVLIDANPPHPEAAAPSRPGREFAFALRFIRGQPAPSTASGGPYSLLAATRVPDRANTAIFLFRTASPLIPPFFTVSSTALDRNNFEVHLHLVAAALRAQG